MTARRPSGFTDLADHEQLAPISAPALTLLFTVPTTTAEQQHRAALAVVARVPDRAAAREVLAMLGLLP